MWNGPDSLNKYHLGVIGTNSLTVSSFLSLRPGNEVVDEILSAGLCLHQEDYVANDGIVLPDVHLLTAIIVKGRTCSYQVHGMPLVPYPLLNKGVKKLAGIIHEKNHWSTVCIDVDKCTFTYMNPLGETSTTAKLYLDNWNSYASKVGYMPFTYMEREHAKQEDSVSCGVIALMLVKRWLQGTSLIAPYMVHMERRNIAHMLYAKLVPYETKCHVCNAGKDQETIPWIVCGICHRYNHITCANQFIEQCILCTSVAQISQKTTHHFKKGSKEKQAEVTEEKLVKEKQPEVTEEKLVKEKQPEVTEEKLVKEKQPEVAEEKLVKEKQPEVAKQKLAEEKQPEGTKRKLAEVIEKKQPQVTEHPKQKRECLYLRGEYVAIRNEQNSFYLCRLCQNIYKSTKKFKVFWLKQAEEVYKLEFVDIIHQDYNCIIQHCKMEKVGKGTFQLASGEEEKIHEGLCEVLDKITVN